MKASRKNFFAQIRRFADEWRYAIRIARIVQKEDDFIIQMWREDIKLFGPYPSDPGELKIGFYYTNSAIPVPGIFFDTEIRDLRNFINEIPGATLTVR